MEKKHLIWILAAIFAAVLVFGLVLELADRPDAPPATEPSDPPAQSGETTAPSTAPSTTAPVETTAVTTEPAATQPNVTTAPTQPPCEHAYEAVVTQPTLQSTGYTTYTCTLCGHSYRDGFTPALSIKDVVNRVKLAPTATGVDALDIQVEMLLDNVADEATAYERLEAVYAYQRDTLRQDSVAVEPLDALDFADGNIFASVNEMVIAYEAAQILEDGRGLPDHYAALFTVLSRGMGFESYVLSGSYRGESHVWNAVVLDGEVYYVDTYSHGGAFLVPRGEADDYTCSNLQETMLAQPGFTKAKALTVTLELKTAKGTQTKTFTWSAKDSGQEAGSFMCCDETVKCSGKVEYTLTVTGGSDVLLTNPQGSAVSGTTLTGTLEAGTDGTLTAEDTASLMCIRIQIDN